jgi:uncharacterized protein YjiS (DUF1127 family)
MPELVLAFASYTTLRDTTYRNARQLATAPDHLLDDMGITRAEADTWFFRQYRGRDLGQFTNTGW